MFSPLFTIPVFIALPDRPLQWTTSSTRAQDATSWRCHQRTTTTSSTWTSRILYLGSDDPWVDLCVALSRAICFLTVLGPFSCFRLMTIMYEFVTQMLMY